LATIARATGWSRRYILWELPYAAGLGMVHAEAMHHGNVMVFCEKREAPGKGLGVREQLAMVRERVASGA